MRTNLFDYELPQQLIAKRPPKERDGARLLELKRDGVRHGVVRNWPERLEPDDLVVLNETRVRRARLEARRQGSGGRVELLLLSRGQPTARGELWEALGKANRPLRSGDELGAAGLSLVVRRKGEQGTLELEAFGDLEQALSSEGTMPIPPYIDRPADEEDAQRYQTVFARDVGSAAAPTAGLHLTMEMLEMLRRRGVRTGRLVLHVGVGTFRPVTAADLDEHPMHEEWISVPESLCEAIEETRRRGGRVVAVGTTVVRALESAKDPAGSGRARPFEGPTRLLIQPGYRFGVVDALLTNFHLPQSTLLALVSAFAGRERVLAAYAEAVKQKYRFLSYGDAMWLPTRMDER